MMKRLILGSFNALRWLLSAAGVAALLLTALVAAPLTRPPPLASVSETARAVDRSTMPGIDRFQARDGTELAYRHYPARAPATGQVGPMRVPVPRSPVRVRCVAKPARVSASAR